MSKITWNGHSCFSVQQDGYVIVFDPYEDGSVPGLGPLRIEGDAVICSHEHHDHNGRTCVALRQREAANPWQITTLYSYHDNKLGRLRGVNNITILDNGSQRIAHMGDIGCMPNDDQLTALSGLDVMMVPIGGYYTMEPADIHTLIQKTAPRIVVPMHYRSDEKGFGYDVIAEAEVFLKDADNVIFLDSNAFDPDVIKGSATVMLTLQNR